MGVPSGPAPRRRRAPTSSRCFPACRRRRPAASRCSSTPRRCPTWPRRRSSSAPAGPAPATIHEIGRAVITRHAHLEQGFTRTAYAQVWDEISQTEAAARVAVSGTADDDEWARSGEATAGDVRALAAITADDDVLEIGCGAGRVGRFLAPACRHWTGGDVSPNMLHFAATSLADLPNVSTVQLNGYDLAGVADRSLDVVYCTGRLHAPRRVGALPLRPRGAARPAPRRAALRRQLQPAGAGRVGALHGALPDGSVEAAGQREPALDAAGAGAVSHPGRLRGCARPHRRPVGDGGGPGAGAAAARDGAAQRRQLSASSAPRRSAVPASARTAHRRLRGC